MSGILNAFTGGTYSSPPGAPTIGSAVATGTTSASVAFTAPTFTGGLSITGYQVVCTGSGSNTATGTSSPITVSGLTANTSYSFKVRAQNSVGYGAYSGNSNSITTFNPVTVSYLIVAGGGSGGYNIGGGGGAGGVLQVTCNSSVMVGGKTYTITVGAGASLGPHSCGNGHGVSGSPSSISCVATACGGGGGTGSPVQSPSTIRAYNGGSGGGGYGGGNPPPLNYQGGLGVCGQGYPGAPQAPWVSGPSCCLTSQYAQGGGGGGAKAVNYPGPQGGSGGAPYTSSITGSSLKYAGGGGAGAASGPGGYGNAGYPYACGGGGAGNQYCGCQHWTTCGLANSGGGGGGGANGGSGYGGRGGSGFVYIKACRLASCVSGACAPVCVGGKKLYKFKTSGTIKF
jgi:hypothetical protein